MKKSGFTEQQIAYALRQAESGVPIEEITRKMGIAQATFYRWKKNVRKAVGDIYVTGWIDSQYKVTGELLITSSKRTFEKYLWQGNCHRRRCILILEA